MKYDLALDWGQWRREAVMTDTTNHFDQRAQTWDADPAKVARAQAVAGAIRRLVPLAPTFRALEYGCGTGLLSFALHADLGPITLADNSDGMLAVLADKLAAQPDLRMRPMTLDLVVDPLPDERFDLVFSLMTFHHVEDVDKVLADLHALLDSPGYLCIADLDAEDGSFHGADFSGHKGFDRDDLAARTRRAGFASADFVTAFRIVRSEGAGQLEFPVFLMVARK
jgi:SAM-dependent methyltransferase